MINRKYFLFCLLMGVVAVGLRYSVNNYNPFRGMDAPPPHPQALEVFSLDFPAMMLTYFPRRYFYLGVTGDYVVTFVLVVAQWIWLRLWWKYARGQSSMHWTAVGLSVLMCLAVVCFAGMFQVQRFASLRTDFEWLRDSPTTWPVCHLLFFPMLLAYVSTTLWALFVSWTLVKYVQKRIHR